MEKRKGVLKVMRKKILFFIIPLFALFFVFSVRAHANSVTDEYIIRESEGLYELYSVGSGEEGLVFSSESLGQLFEHIATDAHVELDGISITELVELNGGKYEISGEAVLSGAGGICVLEGTELSLLSVKLSFSDDSTGAIRVKGGSLRVIGESSIYARRTSPVVVDFSASSSFWLLGGSVSSELSAAIVSSLGSVRLLGGEVDSLDCAAVVNTATLTVAGANISGAVYDIDTLTPIRCSYDGVYNTAEISVRYLDEFSGGDITEILYNTTSDVSALVSLYDKYGAAVTHTFFESSPYSEEKSFSAVYLPYTVSYYDKAERIGTSLVLSDYGHSPMEYTPPIGYTFDGWYSDETLTEPFDFSAPVSANVSVYLKKSLAKPEFSLSSLNFVYDGAEHTLGFDTLTHPLSDSGFFSYTWYKGNERISSASSLNLRAVSDSGSYYCKIKFSYNGDYSEITTPAVDVAVAKKAVDIPIIPAKEYTGYELFADVPASLYYTADVASGVSVGKYSVKLTLTDTDNYRWCVGEENYCLAEFSITKAQNRWTEPPSVNNTFVGNAPRMSATAAFGTVKYLISASPFDGFSDSLPTAVGEYYLVCVVDGSDNYTALRSDPIAFSVLAESVTGLFIESLPKKLSYIAFEGFISEGLSVIADYNSGKRENVSIAALSISYQRADSFRFGDSAVIISYSGVSVSLSVTVSRAEYDLSGIEFSDSSITYDGEYKTLSFSGELPVGLDGVGLSATVYGGGVAAGEYTVSLVFSGESENYKLPDPMTCRFKILPLEVEVIYGSTDFIYNGKPQIPDAYFLNERGIAIPLKLSGAKIAAGENYIATASSPSANYKLKNAEISFTVARADYDMSGVLLSADSFLYDGEEKRVTLIGRPAGVTVIGYTNGTATDAGVYVTAVAFSYDSENYNPPILPKLTWSIAPAEYDMSGVEFFDTVAVYDGNLHYPELRGELPTGSDGIKLTVSYSIGVVAVTDEAVSVTVTFHTESKNYNTPNSLYRTVKLTPKPINVSWSGGELIYSGQEQHPDAYSEYTGITVTGGGINSGSYTAYAESDSKNYTIINSEYEFIIKKADNRWVVEPSISDIFENATLSYTAEALCGAVSFKFYSDPEASAEIERPSALGVYYMVAYADGDENHNPISSEPKRFEIKELLPTALLVALEKTDFVAFEPLLGFATFTVLYNDGGSLPLDPALVEVVYQNGDGLRAGDTAIKFTYRSVSCMVTVNVGLANYDMSGVCWEGSTVFYNGKEQRITLSGLPSGVTVREYRGGVGTTVGSYPVTAYFNYDSANYHAPAPISASLKINKYPISVPDTVRLVYNGDIQQPELPDGAALADSISPKAVGRYTVRLMLDDNENYVFSDGGDTASYDLIISPAVLTVTVADVKLYLFESLDISEYTISGVFADDAVSLEFYEQSGRIHAKSSNPNYTVTVVDGEVERIASLNQNSMRWLLICLLLLAIFGLFVYIIVLHREEILEFFAKRRAYALYRVAEIEGGEVIEGRAHPILALPDGSGEYYSMLSVDMPKADSLITDTMARTLLKRSYDPVVTRGRKKAIVNIGAISDAFTPDEYVDINRLKEKGLVPDDAGYVKILADGIIDKPLFVHANSFSLSAVKMIALTGGEAVRVTTSHGHRK